MHRRWILPGFILPLLPSAAAAQDGTSPGVLNSLDYGIILMAGIVFLVLFFFALQRILRFAGTEIRGSSVIYALGMLFAYLCIAAGSFLVISAVLIIVAIGANVVMFNWLVEFLSRYFPWGGVTVGVLSIAGLGLVLFLLGILTIVRLYGNPFLNPMGVPTKSGSPSKYQHEDKMDLEPLNPTLTFKVLDREKDDPVMDVKVILKQMNGTRYYTKYTDFNGEVTFHDIQGYGSEYFAYVEDDDKREKFRVLRKRTIEQ
ncbi:MAG: hypothetical protein LUQ17_00765 [Methanomicrobiales archaeon]|nr:hypothetical protein [Methanomicrobiales archaeon]